MTINLEQTNQIQQQDINTRKEHWNVLFCWIDFSRTKWKDKVYNKEQQFLPLPNTFVTWQKEVTEYLIQKHSEIERLIGKYHNYFKKEIYPALQNNSGDAVLLFRCKRLFDNKAIGENSSLFLDLLIFEIEYRQQKKFKELITRLNNILFANETINNQWKADLAKMQKGRINYSIANTFWFKWGEKLENRELAEEVNDYLKLWQAGKGAKSEWHKKMTEFANRIREYFSQEENKECFFQLGAVEGQNHLGLTITTQNSKSWDLDNPYLMLFWIHQKPQQVNPLFYRAYSVKQSNIVNTRNLYGTLLLEEDWCWKNYAKAMSSMGSLTSNNHPTYHERNLPD